MSMTAVDVAIEVTIGKEGKYSNNPDDSGGETMWGITKATARKHGYHGAMIDLPRTLAVLIYREEYYLDPGFDKVAQYSQSVANELFDTGVNTGPGLPAHWLQRCLNLLNQQEKLWEDLVVDGDIGQATLSALSSMLKHRKSQGELVLLRMLNSMQGAHYIKLGEAREKDETFIFGWFLHRIMI